MFNYESLLLRQSVNLNLQKEESDPLFEDDSQLFKLGKAALKRINTQDLVPSLKRSVSDPSPDAKHPYKLLVSKI